VRRAAGGPRRAKAHRPTARVVRSLGIVLARSVVKESQGELVAAIVHVVKRRTGRPRQIARREDEQVGCKLDKPFAVPPCVLQIDDSLVLSQIRIDCVMDPADDPLVRGDVAERLTIGKRLAGGDLKRHHSGVQRRRKNRERCDYRRDETNACHTADLKSSYGLRRAVINGERE
jgi:hypothetical protein